MFHTILIFGSTLRKKIIFQKTGTIESTAKWICGQCFATRLIYRHHFVPLYAPKTVTSRTKWASVRCDFLADKLRRPGLPKRFRSPGNPAEVWTPNRIRNIRGIHDGQSEAHNPIRRLSWAFRLIMVKYMRRTSSFRCRVGSCE